MMTDLVKGHTLDEVDSSVQRFTQSMANRQPAPAELEDELDALQGVKRTRPGSSVRCCRGRRCASRSTCTATASRRTTAPRRSRATARMRPDFSREEPY